MPFTPSSGRRARYATSAGVRRSLGSEPVELPRRAPRARHGDLLGTGARRWSNDLRLFYVNDPLVLLAVDGPANEAKGDKDAAGWLPPNTAYDCRYMAEQIAVKTKSWHRVAVQAGGHRFDPGTLHLISVRS